MYFLFTSFSLSLFCRSRIQHSLTTAQMVVVSPLEALETISKQGKPINGIFRLMEDPILWHEAYANIYANAGAMTGEETFLQQEVATWESERNTQQIKVN